MTIHYHGTPITPRRALEELAGRCFCVSYSEPRDVERVHQIGQSVMLDNGAFSAWRQGAPTNWPGYYAWAERWTGCPTTWAVIPDVIDGGEEENESLLGQWPLGIRGAPVWHLHESLDRLRRLCDGWPRVCMGSSGQYREIGSAAWSHRMDAAWNAIIDEAGRCATWVHMLRGMQLTKADYRWPFASVDSNDVARNYKDYGIAPAALAARWDALQCPTIWCSRFQLEMEP